MCSLVLDHLNEMNDDIIGTNSREITINDLTSAIIDGNTYYYFKDNDGQKYKVSIKVAKNKLPFIKNNDTIKIKYDKEVEVITITEIEQEILWKKQKYIIQKILLVIH